MTDSLAHIRRTVADASGATDRTLPAMAELGLRAGEWLMMLLPIVEAIANMPEDGTIANGDGGYRFCPFCRAEQFYNATQLDYQIEHDAECVYVAAVRLKGGTTQ